MADKCSICGGKSDGARLAYKGKVIDSLCVNCKFECECLTNEYVSEIRKTEAARIITYRIKNNLEMSSEVADILTGWLTDAANRENKKSDYMPENKVENKVDHERRVSPNTFWTNSVGALLWIYFFITAIGGAIAGYRFGDNMYYGEEYAARYGFYGFIVGAIVAAITICFIMVLIEISKNNAKQVELLDEIKQMLKSKSDD